MFSVCITFDIIIGITIIIIIGIDDHCPRSAPMRDDKSLNMRTLNSHVLPFFS